MSTSKKVLIVVTSHGVLGSTGKPTGYYLPEVSHPYQALSARGIAVDFASIRGGNAPVDPSSLNMNDPANQRLWQTAETRAQLEATRALADVDPSEYQAIFFAGGHGTMWDFRGDPQVQRLAAIYQAQLPLRVLPVPLKLPPIKMVQVWHERTHADPLHRWFRRRVQLMIGESA